MSHKTMLIVNPVSGKARAKTELFPIVSALCADECGVSVFITAKRGDATEWAKTYSREYERIVCIGGDGTLNEVITGLMALPEAERVPVGYIPLGSTNDMASTYGISGKVSAALENLFESEPQPIDIGNFNGDYFGYVAAFGAFSDIAFKADQKLKNALGYPAYFLSAISAVPNIAPYHAKIEYDGNVIEDDILFGAVVNSTSVAGFMKLREEDVSLDDGLFEVVLIKNPANIIEFGGCANNVLAKRFNTEHITLFHASHVRFTFDRECEWTRDGENGGMHTEAEISICHSAVKLIYSPKKYAETLTSNESEQ